MAKNFKKGIFRHRKCQHGGSGEKKVVLEKLFPPASIENVEGGFIIKAEMTGENTRDLNRELLSSLRKIEKKARLRAEWTSGKITERFFGYVPKGKRES